MSVSKYVKILRERLSNSVGLPFQDILTEDMMQKSLQEENIKYRKRLYDPIVTIWIFICQVLAPDKSCSNAVSRVLSLLSDSDQPLASIDTGAYCKARKRLSLSFIIRLFRHVGQALHQKPANELLWCNRPVFLVDGSTFSMYDTPQNQQDFPQPKNQHQYHGFPVARILGIFCLATGAIIDAAIDSFWVPEIKLFRILYSNLKPGDIALGDRLFGSYGDIALLSQRGIDCVFRMHHLRKPDFSKGKRLGLYDHIVTWTKPKEGTLRLEPELYAQLPETMMVREIRYFLTIKGYRTKVVTLVTTLLDHHIYTYELLAELYGLRWQVEVNLRHLKTTMNMEHIQSKSPQMVRREFYVHLLAYNLIRATLWEAGIKHNINPLKLSYKGAMQHFLNFVPILAMAKDRELIHTLYLVMLNIISQGKLLERPFRIEPRMVRTKKQSFPRLRRPRQEIIQKLVA
jgi:Transposase DDE domain